MSNKTEDNEIRIHWKKERVPFIENKHSVINLTKNLKTTDSSTETHKSISSLKELSLDWGYGGEYFLHLCVQRRVSIYSNQTVSLFQPTASRISNTSSLLYESFSWWKRKHYKYHWHRNCLFYVKLLKKQIYESSNVSTEI